MIIPQKIQQEYMWVSILICLINFVFFLYVFQQKNKYELRANVKLPLLQWWWAVLFHSIVHSQSCIKANANL